MIRVVDASAIAALVFGEQEKPWVEELTDEAELLAPPLLLFELGNICWKKLRRFPLQADVLLLAWTTWCASALVKSEPTDRIQTLILAHENNLTFYDASYLCLARDRTADLISLDAKLVRAARKLGLHAPMPGDGPASQTTPRSRN
jgi:predicted nucleic acid-binding protein